jgi:hypothetical protein
MNSEKQFLQIVNVKPSSVEEMEGMSFVSFSRSFSFFLPRSHYLCMYLSSLEGRPSKIPERMPAVLQRYYQLNDTNVFIYSKPFRKTKEKTDNEFKVPFPNETKKNH